GPPISNFEREINRLIKKSKKPAILVLNKADNPQKRKWAQGLSRLQLGFRQPLAISAANGTGIGDLLDQALKLLPLKKTIRPIEATQDQEPIKVAIMGRPNVGKSTLLNSLLGEEKVIVSSLPHTTRGPQDTLVQIGPDRQSILLVDTAGIRKQAKVESGIEKIGVQKSLKTIQKSDIILMLLDVTSEISHQDKTLLRLIIKNKKGLIIIINKCDLLTKQNLNRLIKTKVINEYLPLARWAPIIFISAKTQQNVNRIFSLIQRVQKNKYLLIHQDKLNKFLEKIIKDKNFKPEVWKNVKMSQIAQNPPEFTLKAPTKIIRRKMISNAQINIIEKQIRKNWDLAGTPIIINLIT
ncbi:GTP-binding protein, partial [Patescibacteria group bacterium]|nr:GTP-binding protein [Patescibacteria group bacterium]